MTDQERLEIMLEYVAGTLDAPQTESVRQALFRGDPTWAAALAEAEATLGAYAAAIAPIDPPPAAKSALMKRIAKDQTAGRTAEPDSFASVRRLAQVFAAVAALILIAVLLNVWVNHKVDVALKTAWDAHSKEMQERDARIIMLTDRINRDGKVIDALHSTSLKVVELGADKGNAIGRILIDDKKHSWQLFTTALSPLPADKTYELWFITPDKRAIAGPTFNVDAAGNAMLAIDLPKDIGPIAVAAITDEAAGGVPVAKGSIQLKGEIR